MAPAVLPGADGLFAGISRRPLFHEGTDAFPIIITVTEFAHELAFEVELLLQGVEVAGAHRLPGAHQRLGRRQGELCGQTVDRLGELRVIDT